MHPDMIGVLLLVSFCENMNRIKNFLYLTRGWVRNLYMYPEFRPHDHSYDDYWKVRNLKSETQLNSFQLKRAEIVISNIEEQCELVDVGAGDGGILLHIHKHKPLKSFVGTDISTSAINLAQEKGVKMIKVDLMQSNDLTLLPQADYYLMFEILEHLKNSEDILMAAMNSSRKGVFFSVPNTGFFTHRLRLLLGKFPLQWRHDPAEHLRFWTVRDMKWWLDSLNIKNYKLHLYEGVPVLRQIFPSLFAQGLMVQIVKE